MAYRRGSSRTSGILSRRLSALGVMLLCVLGLGSAQRVELGTRAVGAGFVDAGPVAGSQAMTLTVRLTMPADRVAALAAKLAEQQDGSTPEYRKWMTPEEFAESFGATDTEVAAATAWLQGQSLTVISVAKAKTTLTVTGTAAQVQAAFGVSVHQLRRGAGSFYGNVTTASVPVDAAARIAGVSGLDDLPGGGDAVGPIATALDANTTPVMRLSSCAIGDDIRPLLEQANAQGVTVVAPAACAGGMAEVTAVALPGDAVLDGVGARPGWQAAPGLPPDGLRYAPDLTASSIDAFAGTIQTLAAQTRVGNINAALYALGPVPGLYSHGGNWEAGSGLGLVDLAKLLTVFPRGTGASFTSLNSTNYGPVHGTSITLTSTVTTGTGGATPTGTVTFATSSGATLGTAPLVSGTATYTTATLPGGTTTIVANYSGDGTYATSSSPTASIFVQPEASVLTAVVSSGNVVGGTYTVMVTDAAGSGVGVPTGTITLTLSGTSTTYTNTLAATGASSSGTTFTIPAAVVGTSTLSINCSGDASYSCGNVLTKTVTVGKATPALTLSYTPNPPVSGASISFSATLTGVGTAAVPTGNVSFFDGTTTINAGRLDGGTVTVSGTDITTATHSISATYDGDANYVSVTVTGATSAGTTATTTSLAASSAVANGMSITLTATVSPAAATGMAGFYDGTLLLGNAPVNGGTATYATAALDTTKSHSITAIYSGDASYKASTSGVVVIAPQNGSGGVVTGSVAASVNPASAAYNSSAMIAVVVTIPTGSTLPTASMVTAQITGLTGTYTAPLIAGTATTATATIAVLVPVPGSYSVAVSCVSSATFSCSNSSSVALTATKGASLTTLAVSPATAVAGDSVTLTATVAASPASAAFTVSATGMVTFYDSGITIGTGTLGAAGTAKLITTVTTGTAHVYTATYAGDTNYMTSTSAGTMITPVPVAPAITVSSSATSTLAGLNVVLTARVAGIADAQGNATAPTGNVNFYDTFSGTAVLLGTATLGASSPGTASATLSSTGLADGTHTIYAIYAGDTLYLTATSAMITVAVSDFNVGFVPQTLTLVQGASGTATLPVTLVGPFTGTIAFACTPPAATQTTCTVSPATLNEAGQVTLTITTTAPGALSSLRIGAGTILACLLWFGVRRRRFATLWLLAGVVAITGCGNGLSAGKVSNGGTPLGTTFFTVTAAGTNGGNTVRHSYQFQVTVRD